MKSFLLGCLFFSMSCYGIFVPLAISAGNDQSDHMSTDKMLEFSLLRLKESVQKTMQKNERLSFENDMMRKGIQDLEKVKENLSKKKAALLDKVDTYHPQKKIQFTGVVNINDRKERTQELISIFQRDIRHLKKEIRVLDDRLSEERFNSHRRIVLERNEKSRKNLIESEKQLESLKKRNLGPKGKIEKLKEMQSELVREVEMLQNEVRRF